MTSAEQRKIIETARQCGIVATVTTHEMGTTVGVDGGSSGWVDVHFITDVATGRIRRAGAGGVVARPDGTHARRIEPKTFAEIADAIHMIRDWG